jgi:hypothetical protein
VSALPCIYSIYIGLNSDFFFFFIVTLSIAPPPPGMSVHLPPAAASSAHASPSSTSSPPGKQRGAARDSLSDTESDTSSLGDLDREALAGIELSSSESEDEGTPETSPRVGRRNDSGIGNGGLGGPAHDAAPSTPVKGDVDQTLLAIDTHTTPMGQRAVKMSVPATSPESQQPAQQPAQQSAQQPTQQSTQQPTQQAPAQSRPGQHRRVLSDTSGIPAFDSGDDKPQPSVVDLIGLDDDDDDDSDEESGSGKGGNRAGADEAGSGPPVVGDLIDLL